GERLTHLLPDALVRLDVVGEPLGPHVQQEAAAVGAAGGGGGQQVVEVRGGSQVRDLLRQVVADQREVRDRGEPVLGAPVGAQEGRLVDGLVDRRAVDAGQGPVGAGDHRVGVDLVPLPEQEGLPCSLRLRGVVGGGGVLSQQTAVGGDQRDPPQRGTEAGRLLLGRGEVVAAVLVPGVGEALVLDQVQQFGDDL